MRGDTVLRLLAGETREGGLNKLLKGSQADLVCFWLGEGCNGQTDSGYFNSDWIGVGRAV